MLNDASLTSCRIKIPNLGHDTLSLTLLHPTSSIIIMSYDREKTVAINAAIAAATLCEQVRQNIAPDAIEKKDKSPVTIADYGSQALICRALAEEFGNDPVIAEEDAAALGSPEMSTPLQQVTDYVQKAVPGATPDEVLK